MRLFQNSGIYPAYIPRLNHLTATASTFAARRDGFLADRFGATHFLKPVLDGERTAFFTNGDDEVQQRLWARENGLQRKVTLEDILLAQIEAHRTEVFYNLDPMRYGSSFVRKLPGCVRKAIAWRAAPSPGADFAAYDVMLCNFPSILESYRQRGWRAEYFSPAHDPEMDAYGANMDRPIDVLFVGGYSRHHRLRAHVLEEVAGLRSSAKVVYNLDCSRLTRLAESPVGYLLPLTSHRRPLHIRAVSHEPVFGRDLYAAISRAKIVLNGAVDMACADRGNMRCFEAMGCGALMISDTGRYPDGMVDGKTMLSYADPAHAVTTIQQALGQPEKARHMVKSAAELMRDRYSKAGQWRDFQHLVQTL